MPERRLAHDELQQPMRSDGIVKAKQLELAPELAVAGGGNRGAAPVARRTRCAWITRVAAPEIVASHEEPGFPRSAVTAPDSAYTRPCRLIASEPSLSASIEAWSGSVPSGSPSLSTLVTFGAARRRACAASKSSAGKDRNTESNRSVLVFAGTLP